MPTNDPQTGLAHDRCDIFGKYILNARSIFLHTMWSTMPCCVMASPDKSALVIFFASVVFGIGVHALDWFRRRHPEESVDMLWQDVFGWAVVGAVAAILIGIGWSVMSTTPPDFTVARACFSVSAAILAIKTCFWLVGLDASRFQRCLAAFVILGVIGAGWAWSYSWVSSRQLAATPPMPAAPTAPLLGGEINVTGLKRPNEKTPQTLLVQAVITNLGSPTVLLSWSIDMRLGDGTMIHGRMVIPPSRTLSLEDMHSNPKGKLLFLRPEEYLPTVMPNNPIEMGGARHGWFLALFPNTSEQYMVDQRVTVILNFEDVHKTPWHLERVVTSENVIKKTYVGDIWQ